MRWRCFRAIRFAAARRVIDVSGDGSNNRGRPVTQARDEAVAAGIGINGLPILALEPDLDRYYQDNVIGGPGAFVVAAGRLRDLRRGDPEEADHRDRERRGAVPVVPVGWSSSSRPTAHGTPVRWVSHALTHYPGATPELWARKDVVSTPCSGG